MKQLFVLILILSYAVVCKGQYEKLPDDSLRVKLYSVMYDLDQLKSSLSDSHKQFQTGSAFFYVSLVAATFGVIFTNQGDVKAGNIILASSGILATIGMVVMIDSHRYIGKAGGWKFEVKEK